MNLTNTAFFLSPDITTIGTDSGTEIFTGSKARFGWRNTLFVIIGTIGFTGNLLTTIIIFSSHTMRCKVTNKLIINQSILDLCGSLMMIASAHIRYDIGGLSGLSGDLYCKLWMTKVLMFGLFISSTYNLIIITIEKYLAIVYPLSIRWKITGRKLLGVIIFIWLFGIFVQSLVIVAPTEVINGYCIMSYNFPSEFLQKLDEVSLLFIFILFPLCVMIFCYSRIFIAINKHSKSFSDGNQSSTENVRERRMFKAKVNIFTTMVVVCLCYFSCWIFNVIVLSLMAFDILPASYFTSPLYDISVNLVFLNCCINPFVYTFKYRDFQIAARTLFCKDNEQGNASFSMNSLSTVASNMG